MIQQNPVTKTAAEAKSIHFANVLRRFDMRPFMRFEA